MLKVLQGNKDLHSSRDEHRDTGMAREQERFGVEKFRKCGMDQ
jgi:hypothetical protein